MFILFTFFSSSFLLKKLDICSSYGFHLGLHLKDKQLIEEIRFKLGNIGNIYEYSSENKNEIHFAVTKKEELKWLIENVFNHYPLLTKHQWDRFSRLKYGILNNIRRVETLEEYQKFVDDIDSKLWKTTQVIDINHPLISGGIDNWILGFINGEGSFVISPKNTFIFYIEQSESFVLEIIKKRLEFAPQVVSRKNRGDGRKNTWSLYISSKKDILNLITFFESQQLISLQGNKLSQYNKWLNTYKRFYTLH